MDDLPEHLPVETDPPEGNPVRLIGGHQLCHAENGAQSLGDHSGKRGTADISLQNDQEKQIKHRVDNRGENQIEQWMPAVSDCLHNSPAAVIKCRSDSTGEIYSQIQCRTRKDFLRRPHQPQNIVREYGADNRESKAGRQRESDVRMDRRGHFFPFPSAEVPGNRDACSDKNAFHQPDQHIDQRAYRAHCCQRIVPKHIADNQRIHGTVELLKQIADHQWKRKAYNLTRNGPFRHTNGRSSPGGEKPFHIPVSSIT